MDSCWSVKYYTLHRHTHGPRIKQMFLTSHSSQMYTFFVDQTTSSTFFDAWLPGFDGGLQQTSSLKYCPKDAQAETEGCGFVTNITGTSYTLVGLYPFTWYRMTVWEVNSAGSSSPVEVVASTAPLPPAKYGKHHEAFVLDWL
ncbi:uncharacterized protein LOC115921465 [Strongylocentrotus purpuratus]|uniref:Fibronectin type-III domain-containing protein n=1 Tax=Strongylocentrotus purpuratus TaxID=7668 RepID=A0A7M7SVS8_STRPU|nr:uncharacterized protein LOC115921465 [Strongylocentrotus purpuratus]